MKTGLILVTLLVAATGCSKKETTSSSNIRTQGIAATITVEAGNSSTEVQALLRVGGDESNTYVILENGDKLTCDAGGDKKDMHAEAEGDYRVTFPTNAAETPFTIALERDKDDPAPNNMVGLPAPFTIGALPTNSPSRANDDLTLSWDSSGTSDNMTVDIKGSCIFSKSIDIPGDSGSYTITKGTLDSTGGDKPEACDLDIVLKRKRKGTTDSNLDNESAIEAVQTRAAKFTSAP